jgi:hypothetical protein
MRSFQLYRCVATVVLLPGLVSTTGCDQLAKDVVRSGASRFAARAVTHSTPSDVREMLAKANARCPLPVDAFTTLQRIEMVDESTVSYFYLVDDRGSQMLAEIKARTLRRNAIEQMRGDPVAVAVTTHGLKVRHVYHDDEGRMVLCYTIDAETLGRKRVEVATEQPPPSSEPVDDSKTTADEDPSAAIGQAGESEGEVNADDESWMPQDLTPRSKKRKEDESWKIRENPFFEA